MKAFNRKTAAVLAAAFIMLGIWMSSIALRALEENKKISAYEVSVDGVVWGIYPDKGDIEKVMARHKMSFIHGLASSVEIRDIFFKQEIIINEVKVYEEELDDFAVFETRFNANEKDAQYHTIEKGDTIWQLRKDLDLGVGVIKVLNPDLNPDKVWPGDMIMIHPADPVIDVEVHLQSTEIEATPFKMIIEKDSTMYTNQFKIVKEGVEGEDSVTKHYVLMNGYEDLSQTEEVSRSTISLPIDGVRKQGTKIILNRSYNTVSSSGGQNYGVASGRLNSNYGNRRHPITGKWTFHAGIDIAGTYGSSINAYADGTVDTVSYSNSYGTYIIIDHGDGLKTRYAHLSGASVSAGDSVSAGQKIGEMGNSGYVTGTHLHFEVIKNGSTVNPLNYL